MDHPFALKAGQAVMIFFYGFTKKSKRRKYAQMSKNYFDPTRLDHPPALLANVGTDIELYFVPSSF